MNAPPRPTPARAAAAAGLLVLLLGPACAERAAGPPPAAAPAGDRARLEPPPVAPATPPEPPRAAPGPTASQKELRRTIVDGVWRIVRDKHFDKTLGGVDWAAARARYEPLAVGAPNEATFYRMLNQMLGELGHSHLEVSGPGAEPIPGLEGEPGAAGGDDAGDTGLVVRVIDGKPVVTGVRPGSVADRAGLKPGYAVTHIGGWAPPPRLPSPRPLRPVEERFYARHAMARRLAGPVGSKVTVRFLDDLDRPGEVVLAREAPPGKPVKIGVLAPLYPDVHVSQVAEVGVIAFNLFLTEGVLPEVQRAIDGFRQRGARAIIFDLRGNPGGLGAVAIPIASRLVDKPLTLGTLHFREHTNVYTAAPPLGVKPFLGRVVILTDEGTASTAEIFAAGLQEAGRAVVVGDSTLGAALPSAIEALPGGAVLQYAVADFRTPRGVSVEGRGVQPNRRVLETRAALRSGRDPVLDAGLVAARASR
jgi:carboxyl-terminal processing protease